VPTFVQPVAAAPAQLDFAAPDPTMPSLSPIQVLPAFWTHGEEARAQKWVARYNTGSINDADEDPYASTGDKAVLSQRPDLLDKPLAQTRFLGADGSVIDVGGYKKPVVVVLLRGFGGQVCLYCAAQTAALCKRIDDFHKAGAEVVVLYPGPAESAPAFIQAVKSLSKEPPPMPVALDVSLLLVRALGVEDNLARPTSLVLDRGGKVRFAYVGKTIADRPSADDLLREVRRIVE
jgi:peroxiredoxin